MAQELRVPASGVAGKTRARGRWLCSPLLLRLAQSVRSAGLLFALGGLVAHAIAVACLQDPLNVAWQANAANEPIPA
jgi:hypothetical protein